MCPGQDTEAGSLRVRTFFTRSRRPAGRAARAAGTGRPGKPAAGAGRRRLQARAGSSPPAPRGSTCKTSPGPPGKATAEAAGQIKNMSSPDGQDHQDDDRFRSGWGGGVESSSSRRPARRDARPPRGCQTMELFDTPGPARHCEAQAAGMTPLGGVSGGAPPVPDPCQADRAGHRPLSSGGGIRAVYQSPASSPP